MFNPVASYRIQFHKDFTFVDLRRLIPYLKKLGVSTIYASPVFEAIKGSTHGYDTVNPLKINPEIGSIEELIELTTLLQAEGISWIQDIVPNHMAYDPQNGWLMDIFEKGTASSYRSFFDQPLSSDFFTGKIMVPFLGSPLEESIDRAEIKTGFTGSHLVLKYGQQQWPCSEESYQAVFGCSKEQVEALTGVDQEYLDKRIALLNMRPDLLKMLAGAQHYRLCSWEETSQTINFRRFFAVNGLICVNIHHPEVFIYFHQLIGKLLHDGVFQGLRVDHIDGLYDPATYLMRLNKLAGDKVPVYVEKILGRQEELPADWPVAGTTGYDFMAQVNNLFTNRSSEQEFTTYYDSLVSAADALPVQPQIRQKKAAFLSGSMNGELKNLTRLFLESNLISQQLLAGIDAAMISKAIASLLIYCPVYRYYGNSLPLTAAEEKEIQALYSDIISEEPGLRPALEVIYTAFTSTRLEEDPAYNRRALTFYQRLMQFTGPVMAKGVEDTLMYTYNRFICHNEVGDSPSAFGISKADFHSFIQRRFEAWPLAMNETSTHDTKRGEDSRARLNVLTDLGDEWFEAVTFWRSINAAPAGVPSPYATDEYFIYQTLVASYPGPGEKDFSERLLTYLEKALREASRNTSYNNPNAGYEATCRNFALRLLDPSTPFHSSFSTFHQKVTDFGIVNSLSQLTLKFLLPGMPDVYQGCEHWDLSLVDPDNRRPVDYSLRQQLLNQAQENFSHADRLAALWQNRHTGAIKVWLTSLLFHERAMNSELFLAGEYLPLKTSGRYEANIFAFARYYRQTWYLVIVPLNLASIYDTLNSVRQHDWEDTHIIVPQELPATFMNLLTGKTIHISNEINAGVIFSVIPLAIYKQDAVPGESM